MVPAEAVYAPCKSCSEIPDVIAYPLGTLLGIALLCLVIMLCRMTYEIVTGQF